MYEGSNGRVLIIEPNGHVRRLVATLLSGLFLEQIIQVRSLTEATDPQLNPHLIILDWPCDHIETLLFVHRIRSGDLFDQRTPILAMSALMHHSILEEAWLNKIDDVIGKPISAIDLIKRSAALLDERWTWKPSAGSMAHQ